MNEFLQMGGYGAYVWSSYGVVAVVLIGLVVWTLAALRGAAADLRDLEAMAPRRRRRRADVQPEPNVEEAPHAQS